MVNKKILTIFILSIFFLSFVTPLTLDNLGTFQQDNNVRVSQICQDATYINLSSVSYPNSSIALNNIEMISAGSGEFYYNFNLTNDIGRYDVRGISDGCLKTFATSFDITYTGKILTGEIITIYIIAILALILLFVVVSFIINYLPSKDSSDEDGSILHISNLKHLRSVLYAVNWSIILAIMFIVSNLGIAYMPSSMIGDLFFAIFKVMFWMSIIVLPLWFLKIFVDIFKDKELKQMIERGVDIKSTP
jgi:uncharacterized membrane protein YhdT